MTFEPVIYRSLALPVSTFEYIKHFQRTALEQTGHRLNNSRTISAICMALDAVFRMAAELLESKDTVRRTIGHNMLNSIMKEIHEVAAPANGGSSNGG